MRLDRGPIRSLADDQIQKARIAKLAQRFDGLAVALVVIRRAGHVRDSHHDEAAVQRTKIEAALELAPRLRLRNGTEEAGVDRVVEQARRGNPAMELRQVVDRVLAVG